MLTQIENDKFNSFHFPVIKVTDLEQFVPIQLASRTPYIDNSSSWFIDETVKISSKFFDSNGNLDIEAIKSRDLIKEDLLKQLNYPCPNEYNFSIPYNVSSRVDWCDYDSTHIFNMFIGENYSEDFKDAILDFGIAIEFPGSNKYTVGRTAPLYDDTYCLIFPYISKLSADLLIIVKAKHIPYLRARLYLKLPITLPIGDMKVLYNIAVGDLGDEIVSQNEFVQFVKNHQPIIEYKTSEEILAYLYPPLELNKSTSDIVRDALIVMEDMLT